MKVDESPYTVDNTVQQVIFEAEIFTGEAKFKN